MLYLDHAATSFPKDPCVGQAMLQALDVAGSPARGGHDGARQGDHVLSRTRRLCARLLGVAALDRIYFALNATDALNMVLKGALAPGDEVVTSAVEHNSVARPLAGLARRRGVIVREVPADSFGRWSAAEVLAAVSARTKVVVLAHASNVTGVIQPVVEVGAGLRQRGSAAWLVVDAAQTVGYRSLSDVAEVAAAIIASGHKGPGGPSGTGFLWLREEVVLQPWREGGTGTESERRDQPTTGAEALEAGTPNLPGIAGLAAAAEQRLEVHGLSTVAAARRAASRQLFDELRGIDGVQLYGPGVDVDREPVVALRVRGFSVAEAAAVLESAFDLVQRAGLHCAPGMHAALGTHPEGTLRFSFGPCPSTAEIQQLAFALRTLAAEPPGELA